MLDACCSGRSDKTSELPFLASCLPHHHPPTQEDSFSRPFFFFPQIQTNHPRVHTPTTTCIQLLYSGPPSACPQHPIARDQSTLDASMLQTQVSLVVKNLPANMGDSRDRGLISGLGGGNGNPLQYSFFFFSPTPVSWRISWTEEPTVHGVAKSQR